MLVLIDTQCFVNFQNQLMNEKVESRALGLFIMMVSEKAEKYIPIEVKKPAEIIPIGKTNGNKKTD